MDELAWCDGKVTQLVEARIPLLDRGYLMGDGVFETMRVTNGRVFRLHDHLQRLETGLRDLGLDAEVIAEVEVAIRELMAAAEGDDLYLRINVTTGAMQDIAGGAGATVTGICKTFQPYPMSHLANGIRVVTAPGVMHSKRAGAGIKSMSFKDSVSARRFAQSQAADDALMRNEHGRLTEASTANLFAVVEDRLHSPGLEEGALPGVTRQAVFELAKDTGIEAVSSLSHEQLVTASEVFLTNTTGGIIPVVKIDDEPVGSGAKGELTTKLARALDAMIWDSA